MVFEYPELQGVMGRIYATVDQEDSTVALAVEEHYLPLNIDGELPKTTLGLVLALADKMDTLAGYFSAGITPSGSQDPYGLRRIATGIIRILKEGKTGLLLSDVLAAAQVMYPHYAGSEQVKGFLLQRMEVIVCARCWRVRQMICTMHSSAW